MTYNLDENGYIANYAVIGGVENGVEYTGELPEGFAACPRAYHVVDGVLTLDADRYAALTAAPPEEPDQTDAMEQRIQELEAVIDALIGGETA